MGSIFTLIRNLAAKIVPLVKDLRPVLEDMSEEPQNQSPSDKFTPDFVRKIFPAATPFSNIKLYWPLILDALIKKGMEDDAMILMALATVRAESEGFAPISEYKSKWNTSPDGKPFDLYNNKASLGNGPDDGAKFRGRGFVQLTGRNNYAEIGRKLGLDDALVNTPENANEPHIAAAILAQYLKSKESEIREALEAEDLPLARKLVNGGSHGLAAFTDTFNKGLSLLAALAAE